MRLLALLLSFLFSPTSWFFPLLLPVLNDYELEIIWQEEVVACCGRGEAMFHLRHYLRVEGKQTRTSTT
jgi:hypothetical protein